MLRLREALESAWDSRTSYRHVTAPGNASLGQCYPTARIVQHYFPESEIVQGLVATTTAEEVHFWNLFPGEVHVDLTWQQFAAGSSVRSWTVRDRETLGDSRETRERCALLLSRVQEHLAQWPGVDRVPSRTS